MDLNETSASTIGRDITLQIHEQRLSSYPKLHSHPIRMGAPMTQRRPDAKKETLPRVNESTNILRRIYLCNGALMSSTRQ